MTLRPEMLSRSQLRGAARKLPEPVKKVLRPVVEEFLSRTPPRLRGLPARRFHAFGVGAPRSGTMSLAMLFARHHEARIEGDHARLNELLNHLHAGTWDPEELARQLQRRDNRLFLELDSAHHLSEVSDVLCSIFPQARFVLMIRDCYSWLESIFGLTLRMQATRQTPWIAAVFQPERFEYTRHDEPLRVAGCLPLEAYLAYFRRINEFVLAHVPEERLFVIRTRELHDQAAALARFVGTPPELLDFSAVHSNRSRIVHGIAKRLDTRYLAERCDHYCSELMERFYPGLVLSPESFPPESSATQKALYQLQVAAEYGTL